MRKRERDLIEDVHVDIAASKVSPRKSTEVVASQLITAWSFDLKLPHDDLSVLDELPIADWDCIRFALQAKAVRDALWWSPSPKPHAEPSDPTPSSVASAAG